MASGSPARGRLGHWIMVSVPASLTGRGKARAYRIQRGPIPDDRPFGCVLHLNGGAFYLAVTGIRASAARSGTISACSPRRLPRPAAIPGPTGPVPDRPDHRPARRPALTRRGPVPSGSPFDEPPPAADEPREPELGRRRRRGRRGSEPVPGSGLDAGADDESDEEEIEPVPIRRPLALAIAGFAGLLGLGLVFGAQTSGPGARIPFALVVFGVQLLYILAWTMAMRPPALLLVAGVSVAVAAGADVAAIVPQVAALGAGRVRGGGRLRGRRARPTGPPDRPGPGHRVTRRHPADRDRRGRVRESDRAQPAADRHPGDLRLPGRERGGAGRRPAHRRGAALAPAGPTGAPRARPAWSSARCSAPWPAA